MGGWQFSPSLLMTVIYLAIGAGMVALGVWQLDRANEKIVMQQAATDAAANTPIDIAQIDASSASVQYTRVKMQGQFEADRQFLWDNRVTQGRVGFEVITPFRVFSSGQLVLVNRGWVPLGISRQALPDVAIEQPSEVQFLGVFTQPSIGFSGGDAVNLTLEEWPRLVQHFDYSQIAQALGEPILSGLVQVVRTDEMSKSSMAGLGLGLGLGAATLYPDNWEPVAFGPERHYGYAFQWFAMFVALSGLYIVLNTKKSLNTKINT